MHSDKSHRHKILLETDLIDNTWNMNLEGVREKLFHFPEVFERHFAIHRDEGEGYSLPLGAINIINGQDCRRLYDLDMYETAISADLYKQIVVVEDVVKSLGVDCTTSDVVRFMMWTKYVASITPDRYDITMDSAIWRPDVAIISKPTDDEDGVYVNRFFSESSKGGRYQRHCSTIECNNVAGEILSAFTNGDWVPTFCTDVVTLPSGRRLSYLTVEVVRKVDNGLEGEEQRKPQNL